MKKQYLNLFEKGQLIRHKRFMDVAFKVDDYFIVNNKEVMIIGSYVSKNFYENGLIFLSKETLTITLNTLMREWESL